MEREWAWWASLSMNQQDAYVAKHFPKTFTFRGKKIRVWTAIEIIKRPAWILEIWEKEGQPKPVTTGQRGQNADKS